MSSAFEAGGGAGDDDGGDDRTDQAGVFRSEGFGSEIARRLHVSRKTVRRAIEAEDGKFSYDRAVQPMPKLGAHVADLERLLAENESKPKRERLTLVRLFEALRGLGYAGGYDGDCQEFCVGAG